MQRIRGNLLHTDSGLTLVIVNKKLSWCWQTRATRSEVSQGHQTWYHSI